MHNEECRMHKSIKLNYFEHRTVLRVVKKLVLIIGLVSSSLKWCVFLQEKLKWFVLQNYFHRLISIHCEVTEKKHYVSVT